MLGIHDDSTFIIFPARYASFFRFAALVAGRFASVVCLSSPRSKCMHINRTITTNQKNSWRIGACPTFSALRRREISLLLHACFRKGTNEEGKKKGGAIHVVARSGCERTPQPCCSAPWPHGRGRPARPEKRWCCTVPVGFANVSNQWCDATRRAPVLH